ncbi:delta(14)-sterol reductase LBR-like [Symsagittifera roscoffensis]|uniref:delta(14)-sterol reductase LBR-like n=1 Tax=Symsagittifera roscoffensis TaxID=84072 RepID=UPI00307CB40A
MKLRGGGHNSEPGVAIRYAECGTATTVCQPRPNSILMLICVMNILPVVLISSYKNSVGCGVLSGLFCIGDMSEKGLLEYLNVEAFVMLSCWYCLQLVLAGAPVGALARYENNETGEHVCIRHNAVFALYVSLSLIFLTEHLSGDAIEGLEIFNFFVGKATHPLITGIDMKRFLCLRPGTHSLLQSTTRVSSSNTRFNCAFVVLAIFHFCYVLQAMNLEIDFLATFRYSRDGFGYMHAWYSLVFIPFFYGLQSYYLFDLSNSPSTEASLGGWGMLSSSVPGVVLGSVLFFSGHYLLDVSTKQKTIFR